MFYVLDSSIVTNPGRRTPWRRWRVRMHLGGRWARCPWAASVASPVAPSATSGTAAARHNINTWLRAARGVPTHLQLHRTVWTDHGDYGWSEVLEPQTWLVACFVGNIGEIGVDHNVCVLRARQQHVICQINYHLTDLIGSIKNKRWTNWILRAYKVEHKKLRTVKCYKLSSCIFLFSNPRLAFLLPSMMLNVQYVQAHYKHDKNLNECDREVSI